MANRNFKNVKRMVANISEDTYKAAESGGGGTEAEFLALKNIFETDFNLVIESDNLDDLIIEVNSYFDTTKVIALGSTLNATAFKNVLQKYLGTLDIDLSYDDSIMINVFGNDGDIYIDIRLVAGEDVDAISILMSGSNYYLNGTPLSLATQMTNLEDILNNQTVIDYLNSGVLTYGGPETSNGLQIQSSNLYKYISDSDIEEEKMTKPADILSMFNAPSPNAK